jgi:hypothetical protein
MYAKHSWMEVTTQLDEPEAYLAAPLATRGKMLQAMPRDHQWTDEQTDRQTDRIQP